ncbi:MAG: thiol:disulfide interchange protein DsbG [Alcanivorax sp.]|nr:thiol:disulfide interchange protein DsbG [Alcanivorax sp.]
MTRILVLLASLLLPAFSQASPAQLLKELQASTWVAEGPQQPQRVAYLFTDMACPYCARLWQQMQPLLQDPANTLQVRSIIVGLINPQTSFTQGAAVLAADDPADALARHENHYRQGGIAPLEPVPAAQRQAIVANTRLMMSLGLSGTPTLIFQDRQHHWRVARGLVDVRDLRDAVFQLDAQ